MSIHADTYQLLGRRSLARTRGGERFLLLTTLIVVDLIMILLGFWLAYNLRFEVSFAWFYQHEIPPFSFYRWLVFLLAPFWIVVFTLFGLYDFRNLFSGMQEYTQAFNACTLTIMLIIFSTFFDPNFVVARGWVILSWLLVSFFVILGRFMMRRGVQRLRGSGHFLTTVLIVGANEEGQAIAHQLQGNLKAGIRVLGFADDTAVKSEVPSGIPVLGSIGALPTLVKKHNVQEIIVASTALRREQLINLFQTFDATDISIYMSSGLYELLTTGVEVHEVANVPLMSVNKVRLAGVDVILKRALDLVVSTAALIAFLPIISLIAVVIKLNSSGPIFYLRRVVGVGGKPFNALKFRTMYTDADERLNRDPELRRQFEENFKLKDDPRVTSVGRILRTLSLDELPQLFNVLQGQMSLVGPRMITEPERTRYGKWSMNLATVKPGITGLWQVSGRSDISYDDRVRLDMHYIRNYSIWFDLHILWQTIPAVLKRRGAY
ncbi:MAG: sugar transferase [Anaerolineae bacterium]|nr:sugar transferase [Anaerolineae bacterium]